MNGYELNEELNAKLAECDSSIREMRKSGRNLAQAEAAYRSALAAKMLELRAKGQPASVLKDLARGDSSVNALLFQFDLAASDHEADKEVVMLRKREADVIREQLAREWSRAGWSR